MSVVQLTKALVGATVMRKSRNFYDERGLLYFDSVCQSGGIRRAADVLHVSPSAISRQIKLLEDQLGATLLINVGRKMSLTAVGHCLSRYITKIKAAENDLLSEIAQVQNFDVGRIRIASGGGFISPLINGVIRLFNEQYPGITYRIDIESGEAVSRMIAEDKADIGFVFSSEECADPNCVASLPCGDIKLVSRSDSRFKIGEITRECLQTVPIITLKPGFTIYTAVMKKLDDLGVHQFNNVVECDSFAALIEAVKCDLGVTLLPRFCVSAAIDQDVIRCHDLPATPGEGPFLRILATQDRMTSPLLRFFSEIAQSHFSKRYVL